MRNIILKILNPSSLYVLVTVFVSAVGFVRSFLFMKWLDMGELGVISLVQTVIMFLSLFQLGLINGGYRIFALDKIEEQRRINNVLFSYFSIIGAISIILWIILVATNTVLVISNKYMLLALVCGVLSLMQNWLTNTLIGKRLIRDINIINFISTSFTLIAILLILVWGIDGAIISLVIQPLLFVALILIKHVDLRPTAWNFNTKLIKYILSFGFIPFLAGIFVLINMQIERWCIAEVLGVEELGNFYLIFLYSTLFVLIPASLLSLFFPKAIYAYENSGMLQFKNILKKHLLILGVYLFSIACITLFAMQYVIDWLLPQHSDNTIYVYYFLPGMIALVLCDPIAIIFNSAVKLKPMLYAGLAGVLTNIVLIYIITELEMFTLVNMAIIKTIINILTLAIYSLALFLNYKTIFKINQ